MNNAPAAPVQATPTAAVLGAVTTLVEKYGMAVLSWPAEEIERGIRALVAETEARGLIAVQN